MRRILNSEIKKEVCNAAAFGAFNRAVSSFNKTQKEGNFQFQNISGRIFRRDNKTGKVTYVQKQVKDLKPSSNFFIGWKK